MMKTKYIFKGLITILLLAISISSCESYNEALLDNIGNSREFSPIGLTAKIRNSTTVELNWSVKKDEAPDHFVVEFSADDPEFKTIYKTINVTASQLPVQVALEGETVYSIRVKAVSGKGLEDSKWYITTATTLTEQIFFPVQDADIEATKVTLRWTPNSAVTQISVEPGSITHTITAAEKTAGVATVTGLTGETAYTATLLNGTKKRGVVTFTTGIDIGTGILVKPEDDVLQKITDAPAGSVLVFMPGDYKVYTGDIALNKSITLRGLRPGDKPKLHNTFTVNVGTSNLSLIDLDLDGTGITNGSVITFGVSGTFGDVLVSGCRVHDFTRSFLSNTATGAAAKINSFTIDNCIVKNVNTNAGAEFIDVRSGVVTNIVLQNSTFDTCSDSREFIRLDASTGLTGTGLTTNVLINNCTLYKVCTTAASKRLLYSRFASNASTVKNTIITDAPAAIYSNQNGTSTPTTPPTFSNNNYYNASLLYTVGAAAITVDKSTSYTTLNPQFVDAAAGNFKVQNQTLIDNNIGDPRWLK
ncbi:DUF4957 domain-containing protein [Flavobacterium sp. LPB0248]|uniref:DUF5123 domain-containing protein n=1 Tax=Flavobacterium sp. LPB0248 TaxID=2614441 RepID=UPI0015A65004|nr:DUF5123 domain-containing protein [Flavobacterium sp. LPB0248]QLC67631.1 DUF4957 domain-containing protein [Flavobacterium sp. LPB0248]